MRAANGYRGLSKSMTLANRSPYCPPALLKRTREQATLLLVGHAWLGHKGARDLLELLIRRPNVTHPSSACTSPENTSQ
jgi:hypothetical protein